MHHIVLEMHFGLDKTLGDKSDAIIIIGVVHHEQAENKPEKADHMPVNRAVQPGAKPLQVGRHAANVHISTSDTTASDVTAKVDLFFI